MHSHLNQLELVCIQYLKIMSKKYTLHELIHKLTF